MAASAILAAHGGTARLSVVGELDGTARDRLTEVAEALAAETVLGVELDLRGVTAIDAAGVAWLLRLQRAAWGRCRRPRLVDPSPQVSGALSGVGMGGPVGRAPTSFGSFPAACPPGCAQR